MDAHALLTSQGWRGTGHSLHPTSDSNGLSRPILVSRKQNTLGIGKKQHRTSDMWWMNAFDSSLKGLDTSKDGVVLQTVTSGGLDMVARGGGKYVGKGGLYACFVRGEGLGGTLTPVSLDERIEVTSGEERAAEGGKKRKREEKVTKEERRARKSALKAKELDDLAVKAPKHESGDSTPEIREETKEERRSRKAAKKALGGQEANTNESDGVETPQEEETETKQQRRERRRLKKLTEEKIPTDPETEATQTAKPESKEDRKERKRLKKLAKQTPTDSTEVSSEESSKNKKKWQEQ